MCNTCLIHQCSCTDFRDIPSSTLASLAILLSRFFLWPLARQSACGAVGPTQTCIHDFFQLAFGRFLKVATRCFLSVVISESVMAKSIFQQPSRFFRPMLFFSPTAQCRFLTLHVCSMSLNASFGMGWNAVLHYYPCQPLYIEIPECRHQIPEMSCNMSHNTTI